MGTRFFGEISTDHDLVDKKYVDDGLAAKQGTLTAGTGINITNNVISATGGGGTETYTMGWDEPNLALTLTDGTTTQTLPLTGVCTTGYVDAADAALQTQIDALGEPFRVKNWASSFTVEIPTCTEDISNTSIAKMVFSITGEEGEQFQVVGMIAYEVFDAASGGNRINCWPVCQFTGNGQKELSVRWMCGGTTRKTAKRINAWVLLKHR